LTTPVTPEVTSVGGRGLGVLVFVVGAASLGVEIAAARLLAPLVAAALIAVVPFAARPFLGFSVEAFEGLSLDPIADTNTLLVGGGAHISAERLEATATALPFDLRPIALAASARLEPRLPGGEVFTDDHAPVEWLIDDSLLEYADG
jgi:hypothetical protein